MDVCVFCAVGLTEELEEMITSAVRKEPIFSSTSVLTVHECQENGKTVIMMAEKVRSFYEIGL